MRSTKVTASIDSGMPLQRTSCTDGIRPVIRLARFGWHTGLATWKRSNAVPRAAIESMWDTEPAPASFTLVGIPDAKGRKTDYAVKIPWVLGLITTRSINRQVPGINDLVKLAAVRIRNGLVAYNTLARLRADRRSRAPVRAR